MYVCMYLSFILIYWHVSDVTFYILKHILYFKLSTSGVLVVHRCCGAASGVLVARRCCGAASTVPKAGMKTNFCYKSYPSDDRCVIIKKLILCVCRSVGFLFPANCSKIQYHKRRTCGGPVSV